MAGKDGELLGLFLSHRDAAAFEELVRRHGPMVMGLCRRMLGSPEDAEDAFQAVFVVLAAKAASLRRRESVGSWLHGVALRVAMKARTAAATRREYERRAAAMMMAADDGRAWSDIRPVLDEELDRLPEKYRAPVVLCCLEGHSQDEAAASLGWTEGELRGRLARGRELLRERLARRGVVIAGVALAALIATNASAATVPAACVAGATNAALAVLAGKAALAGAISAKAASLADAALRVMLWAKIKAAAVVAAIALSGATVALVGTGALRGAAAPPPPVPLAVKAEVQPPAAPERPEAAEAAPAEIEGEDEAEDEGEEIPAGDLPAAVSAAFKARHPAGRILEAEKALRRGRTVYKADVEDAGVKYELEAEADGKVIRDRKAREQDMPKPKEPAGEAAGPEGVF